VGRSGNERKREQGQKIEQHREQDRGWRVRERKRERTRGKTKERVKKEGWEEGARPRRNEHCVAADFQIRHSVCVAFE